MIDTNAELERVKIALRAIAGAPLVATNWPANFDTLPCVLVQEAGESAADHRDDAEYLTEIEWYVRVFGKKEAEHRQLCAAVRTAMESIGYTRTFRWDEGGPNVRLTVFRFQTTR